MAAALLSTTPRQRPKSSTNDFEPTRRIGTDSRRNLLPAEVSRLYWFETRLSSISQLRCGLTTGVTLLRQPSNQYERVLKVSKVVYHQYESSPSHFHRCLKLVSGHRIIHPSRSVNLSPTAQFPRGAHRIPGPSRRRSSQRQPPHIFASRQGKALLCVSLHVWAGFQLRGVQL